MDAKMISMAVMILLQAAGVVWFIAGLKSDVQHNNYQIQMIAKATDKNSNFVELWPQGKLGELPSDTRQDLKIERLEAQVANLTNKVYGNGP